MTEDAGLESKIRFMGKDKTLTTMETDLSALLSTFDRLMLHDYSEEKSRAYEQASTPIYAIGSVLRTVDEVRRFYNELDHEQREEFLYGLRKAVLESLGAIRRIEKSRISVLGVIKPLRSAVEKSGQNSNAITCIVDNYERERSIVISNYQVLYTAMRDITKSFGHTMLF